MEEERREPRIPVSIQGRYRTGSGLAKDVVVSDLSGSGCKFYDRFTNLKLDDRLTIRVGSIGPIDGVVRWRAGQIIGIKFAAPLHSSVLEHMVSTISDWTAPPDSLPPGDEAAEPAAAPALAEIAIRIRPPTVTDFRDALGELDLKLPLATEEELEAVFHHVLNAIFVRVSDD